MNIDDEAESDATVEVWTRRPRGGEVINGVLKSPSVHTALGSVGQLLLLALQWKKDVDSSY